MKDETTTPGPWYIEQDADTWHLLDGKSNDLLSECDMSVEMAEANAKLAASAPILKELVEKQGNYIKLLGEELDDLASIAFADGWRSTRFADGCKFREEIEQLKSKLK